MEAVNATKTVDKGFQQNGSNGKLFNDLEMFTRPRSKSTYYIPVEKPIRLAQKYHQGVVATINLIDGL